MDKRRNNLQNGITLIALVISIIVMLILAGVSLNATIGDNGIITQAQNATYLQSCAVLEEYLQEEYIKYFDEEDNYQNKIELLASKYYDAYNKDLCLKDGSKNYILNTNAEGKIIKYYLINKENLPKEIRESLKGGDTSEYSEYIRLQNVYGVTPDLKVFYCESGLSSNIYGQISNDELDPTTPLIKINKDSELKKLINTALGKNENHELTISDIQGLKKLEIDGTKNNITTLEGISEATSLQELILSNLSLNSLVGLQSCININKIYFKNSIVNDYTNLKNLYELNTIYIYLPQTITENVANEQINKFCLGLKDAENLSKLSTLGISGINQIYENPNGANTIDTALYWGTFTDKGNLSDISSLSIINKTIKDNLKVLYLNNNNILTISSLDEFVGLQRLFVFMNSNLQNLDGISNHKNMYILVASQTGITNINALRGCSALRLLYINQNPNLTSLSGIEDSLKVRGTSNLLMAFSCNITDITSLAGNNIINYINLYSNVNLKNVKTLGDCINLKSIYLANNEAMIGTEVSEALGNSETHILQNCGSNYSLPNKYLIYFSNLTKYDLSNLDLTDESDEINAMKNKTNVTSLNLAGNSKLSNEKLQEVLSTMTGLKALKLQNCSNLSSIDFIGQNKVTGLIELDIRGTSSSLTDLSNLEEYALDLQTLALNNYNVDFSKIQNTINRFDLTTQNPYSWRGESAWEFRGLVLSGDCSQYSFENCTNIKQLISNVGAHYSWDSTYGILDLTPCVNMKFIYTWGRTGTYKLPSSIVNIEHTQGGVYDLSLCYNLKKYYAEIGNSMITELKTLNPKAKLQSISSMRGTPTDLSFLQYIDTSELTELWIYSNGVYYQPSQLNSVQGIEYATNLKSLELSGSATLDGNINLSSLTKLTSLSIHSNIKLDKVILTNENGIGVTNLVALNASNCEIVEISGLEYNVSLENLYINTNKIQDISNISNLINLKEIYINNNAISDLSPLQNLINNCLNKTVLFKKIYMNDNVIQNYSTNGVDNIKCIVDLYNAGCKTIDVRNNSFSDTTELSKYSGISY